jgi:hypothetical protein
VISAKINDSYPLLGFDRNFDGSPISSEAVAKLSVCALAACGGYHFWGSIERLYAESKDFSNHFHRQKVLFI